MTAAEFTPKQIRQLVSNTKIMIKLALDCYEVGYQEGRRCRYD